MWVSVVSLQRAVWHGGITAHARIISSWCGSGAGAYNYGYFRKATRREVATLPPELLRGPGRESSWWERGVHRLIETWFPPRQLSVTARCFEQRRVEGTRVDVFCSQGWRLGRDLCVRACEYVCMCMWLCFLSGPLRCKRGIESTFPAGTKCSGFLKWENEGEDLESI